MLPPDDPHDGRAGDPGDGARFDGDPGDGDLYCEGVPPGGAGGEQTHEGLPISEFNGGEPIPDLSRIPQAQWRAALASVSRHTRRLAVASAPTIDGARIASIIVGDLLLTDDDTARARTAPPPAAHAGARLTRGSPRQVGFRLGPDDYARLQHAARLYGMRPSALARLLTVRGVNLALHDERRGT